MSLRDYGLPDPEPIGAPTWKRTPEDAPPCPNCGSHLCEVTVAAKLPQLRGGKGICTYLGCPACPWASPSVTRAVVVEGAEGDPVEEMLEELCRPSRPKPVC